MGREKIPLTARQRPAPKDLMDWLARANVPGTVNLTVYGVRKADIDAVKAKKNWVNLEDHIVAQLTKLDDKFWMGILHSELDSYSFLRYNSNIKAHITAPGTVVELGGIAEITQSNTELSDKVFGVISTNAAYLMNSKAGTNLTHPPVAMTGRVPVKVTGVVNKGDRLVSAGEGMARSAQPGEASTFNVIGRALVSKLDAGVGTVEAIVTVK